MEPQLREELKAWFDCNQLSEANVDECMGIIDRYLNKEQRKAKPQQNEAAAALKSASLTEQLIFVSSMPQVSPQMVRKFGLDPSLIRKAQIAKMVETSSAGIIRGLNKGRLLEQDLKPGQSVYRVKGGKVQQVTVVGQTGQAVQVASGTKGDEVEDVDPKELSSEEPEELGKPSPGGVVPTPAVSPGIR